MFTNLIESQSHVREFKRRSSFFLITVVGYAIALTGAGVASVFAYDAQLEAQSSSLELLSWVPPVTPEPPRPINEVRPAIRRTQPSTAPSDPRVRSLIAESAKELSLTTKVMPSGAGHDAQAMATLGPMGMIFVPSIGGISHSPKELSRPNDIVNGANVLLATLLRLDEAW